LHQQKQQRNSSKETVNPNRTKYQSIWIDQQSEDISSMQQRKEQQRNNDWFD
jgi:hypothetical protein